MTRGGIYAEIQPEHKGNPEGEPEGFPEGPGNFSPYIPTWVIIQAFSISKSYTSSIILHGRSLLVTAKIDAALPFEIIASLEEMIAAMMTQSHCNSHSHSHYFNHPSLHPSIHPSIHLAIHWWFDPYVHPFIQSTISFFVSTTSLPHF